MRNAASARMTRGPLATKPAGDICITRQHVQGSATAVANVAVQIAQSTVDLGCNNNPASDAFE